MVALMVGSTITSSAKEIGFLFSSFYAHILHTSNSLCWGVLQVHEQGQGHHQVEQQLLCLTHTNLFSLSRLYADDDTIRHYRLSVEHASCLWEVFFLCHSLYKQL
ncbi:hypothetical protein J6590_044892 [Homalodisca vitripennis]|nr:hypothetical protein J6590_044892 [Homalodisca vitripennis]